MLVACTETTQTSSVADAGPGPIDARVEALFGDGVLCGRTYDQRIYCWRSGYDDRIAGARSVEGHGKLVFLSSFPDSSFKCAALPSGEVACWGSDASGGLGYAPPDRCFWDAGPLPSLFNPPSGPYACALEPHVLSGIVGAVQVAGSCARTGGGEVWCWPYDSDAPPERTSLPFVGRRLHLPSRAARIVTDSFDVGRCFLLVDGRVACQGRLPTFEAPDACQMACGEPTIVPSLAGALDLSLGFGTSCAVLGDGRAVCGGERTGGARGDGKCTDMRTFDDGPPSDVKTDLRFRRVGVLYGLACGLTDDARVACWGVAPDDAPIGGSVYACPNSADGTSITKQSLPVIVPGLADVAELVVRQDEVWVRRNDGFVLRVRDVLGSPTTVQMAP
jgi:hypothetical protein